MCLAVPGKLVQWLQQDAPFSQAWVEFAGVRRKVNMACLPQAKIGDYLLVHAGVAISGIDEEEARRVQRWIAEVGLESDDESSSQRQELPASKSDQP